MVPKARQIQYNFAPGLDRWSVMELPQQLVLWSFTDASYINRIQSNLWQGIGEPKPGGSYRKLNG